MTAGTRLTRRASGRVGPTPPRASGGSWRRHPARPVGWGRHTEAVTTTWRPTRRSASAGAALVAALTLSSCGGGGEPGLNPAESLREAEQVLREAGSVQLVLEGSDLPEEGSYIIAADGAGSMEPPAFEGTITARMAGIQADVPTVAVDGELHVQLPYTPGYTQVSPESLGVPDPARLFDPEAGMVSLLPQTQDPQLGEEVRAGSEVLREVTGTLPGEVVVDLLAAGDPEAVFDVTYGLVEQTWQTRTVHITGPFYPPAQSSYTLTLDGYGEPVSVEAP